jgi:hypothetical protein
VTSIVAMVIRGEAAWDDVLPDLTRLVDETVEYGSRAEVNLAAELQGERDRGARAVAELEERLTTARERGASRVADAEARLSAEIARRAEVAQELAAERARSATLAAELAKRPAAATEPTAADDRADDTLPGTR